MACNIGIRKPTTLKEALELLDVMDKSFGGSAQGVQKVFNKELGSKSIAAFSNFQSAHRNASSLRAAIVGFGRVSKYGSYGHLKSYGNDYHCGSEIIAILKSLLPKLIKTLNFLLKEVAIKTNDGWGMQTCNGQNYGRSYSNIKDLHEWLKSKYSTASSPLPGGYEAYELVSSTGDRLTTWLVPLVKDQNRGLHQLNTDISGIKVTRISRPEQSHQHESPRGTPHPQPGQHPANKYHSYGQDHEGRHPQGSSPHGSSPQFPPPPPPPPPAPSPGQPQAHQGSRYSPAEYQPSHNDGSSSTAAIGGAVGATGLVGGSAAVYFLNIGGIRTLIAG